MNPIQNKKVVFQPLGLIDYQEAWDYQEKLFADTIQLKIENRKFPEVEQKVTPNYLLFCQHPHVYTLGKSGDLENLLLDEQGLAERQVTFYKINRGGDITYHGPGQIVAYPILDLDNFFTDIHRYLRYLEEAVILTLADYGLEAGRIDGLTGVWLDHVEQENPRKICAMGVKSSRWVTMHGLAFNVNSDLQYFEYIVPCGIKDKAVTSLEKELGGRQNIREVEEKLKQHLSDLFEMELEADTSRLSSEAKLEL
ncbi:lipoyl(octanoyl) transferase [Catalinimonas alkaloidigena]|uniref:lipoyl(octanoyl) transferase LipB n=1 Tax=Catalinimonas alkaloidigena TaxID=1075417 RepID=UPI002405ECB1|nr:lipoyl(octanoyl) transferase LipB [Catalinimonas alkaloidigena]MDF9801014.1 lipoyl(octanoyl) transferase [Catalinimonas alkaloidigena]